MKMTIALFCTLLVISCSEKQDLTKPETRHVVGTVDLNDVVTTTGEVRPVTAVDLKSEASGRIEKVLVREGQAVKRGDTLLTIDPARLLYKKKRTELSVETALVHKNRSHRNLHNARRLVSSGSVSQSTLADLESEFQLASLAHRQHLLELNDIKDELTQTIVISPLDGVITMLGVKEGEIAVSATSHAAGGTPIATIADIARLEVLSRIGEADYTSLSVGHKVRIRPESRNASPIEGTIDFLSLSAKKAPGEELGTFEVRIRVDSTSTDIVPGMNVTVELPLLHRSNVLGVPCRYVVTRPDGAYVNRVSDRGGKEQIEAVRVELGATDFRHYEIKSGLHPGDILIPPGPQPESAEAER